jgi:hypothetical protein
MDSFTSEDGNTIYYWPYCPDCKQPYSFDPEEPFAFCDCGTSEWGNPRPAEWIPDPNYAKRVVDVATAVRDNPAKVPIEHVPSSGRPGSHFQQSVASAYASRAFIELDGALKP